MVDTDGSIELWQPHSLMATFASTALIILNYVWTLSLGYNVKGSKKIWKNAWHEQRNIFSKMNNWAENEFAKQSLACLPLKTIEIKFNFKLISIRKYPIEGI